MGGGGWGLSSMVNRIRDIERVASYHPGCVSSRKLTIFLAKSNDTMYVLVREISKIQALFT